MGERVDAPGEKTAAERVVELDSALWRRLLVRGDEGAFFESWLALQARQLPKVLGAVLVVLDEEGHLRPVSYWPKSASPGLAVMKAAQSAVRRRVGVVRRADDEGVASFAYPVLVEDEVVAVAGFNLSRAREEELQSALRRVQWGAVWLENHFRERRAERLEDAAGRLSQTLDLVAVSLEEESAEAAALAVMTETAARLDCERASIGFRRRTGFRVLAISHTSEVARRQNLVRGIAAAMDEACDQGRPVVYPAGEEDHLVVVKHRELSQRLGAAGPVVTVPLIDDDRAFGAVTVEYPPEKVLSEADIDTATAFASLAGRVLEHRRREDRLLIGKAAEATVRQVARLIGPGYMGRKAALAVLAALVVFFSLYHTTFHVPARAALEGEVQRLMTAPFDGYIAEERARPGDLVSEGDVVARLDDRELQLELAAWTSRRAQYEAERLSALAEHDIGRAKVYEAQIAEADVQIDLVRKKLDLATVTAPFDGIILSGDLSQALGSGVRLGDPLFEIAPLSSYRVVLKVDEEDIHEIEEGLSGRLVLASRPGAPLDLSVERITSVTVPEEGRNHFRVEARLHEAPEALRPGMEGVAKIAAGERRLIWIWTRRAVNWLRVQLWKWTP